MIIRTITMGNKQVHELCWKLLDLERQGKLIKSVYADKDKTVIEVIQ